MISFVKWAPEIYKISIVDISHIKPAYFKKLFLVLVPSKNIINMNPVCPEKNRSFVGALGTKIEG